MEYSKIKGEERDKMKSKCIMSAIHTSRQVTSHSTTPGHHSSSADWLKVETVHTSKYRTMGKRRSPLRLFFSNTNHNNENSKQYKTKTMKKKKRKRKQRQDYSRGRGTNHAGKAIFLSKPRL
jgi:hypothetical protein